MAIDRVAMKGGVKYEGEEYVAINGRGVAKKGRGAAKKGRSVRNCC